MIFNWQNYFSKLSRLIFEKISSILPLYPRDWSPKVWLTKKKHTKNMSMIKKSPEVFISYFFILPLFDTMLESAKRWLTQIQRGRIPNPQKSECSKRDAALGAYRGGQAQEIEKEFWMLEVVVGCRESRHSIRCSDSAI